MRLTKKIIYSSLATGVMLLGLSGCEENALVFPTQIDVEGSEHAQRGPVKQGNFTVITEYDEKVKFDLSTVDTERIASIVFSHDRDGEAVVTEVTNFSDLYVISNLPLDASTAVTVWAKGKDGKESKPFVYEVTPQPYPAGMVARTTEVLSAVRGGTIRMSNTTDTEVTFHYAIDGESTFTSVIIPTASINREVSFPKVTIGMHTVTYYFTDDTGGQTDQVTEEFEALAPPLINFTTTAQKAGWTPYSSHPYGPGWASNLALDGADQINYTAPAEVHTYYIHFTNSRVPSSNDAWNTPEVMSPAGPFTPITIKSVSLTFAAWGTNPMIYRLYGVDADRNEVLLNDLSVESFGSGTVTIPTTDNTDEFIGFKLEMRRPTGSSQFALQEIDVTGYLE